MVNVFRSIYLVRLTRDLLIVEGDLNLVGDGLLWGVGDQALATSKNLDLVGDISVVDGDFKLAFSSLWGVNSEGAQDSDHAVGDVSHLFEIGSEFNF